MCIYPKACSPFSEHHRLLQVLFDHPQPWWVAAYAAFMMAVASFEAVHRPSKSYPVRPCCSLFSAKQHCALDCRFDW